MSPTIEALWLPEWLRTWIQQQLLPALGLQSRQLALGFARGAGDTLLLLLLAAGLLSGGRLYMDGQYTLSRTHQDTILQWAPVADQIARRMDIPREVPLVLWYKENSLLAKNPANCTGIAGLYDLVRSGAHTCFAPGPLTPVEIRNQLQLAAQAFKDRCPQVSYLTHDPRVLKRCYFAYNAGPSAAARLDADESAYVMNGYDSAHRDMVYQDVELGTVTVTALGAWPVHLAIQSLIVTNLDQAERPLSLTLLDMSTRVYDSVVTTARDLGFLPAAGTGLMNFPAERDKAAANCLAPPHRLGRPSLRPRLNPVSADPILTQDVHGCSYGLPGLDISSSDKTATLQAPMPGAVTTFTDRWYNSTIRIENDEWIVWLLHARSYTMAAGDVDRGKTVGVMGAVGVATGPHVHYTIYDKVADSFVDPRLFLPQGPSD